MSRSVGHTNSISFFSFILMCDTTTFRMTPPTWIDDDEMNRKLRPCWSTLNDTLNGSSKKSKSGLKMCCLCLRFCLIVWSMCNWGGKKMLLSSRPKSGSMLLYSRKKVRYRRDGYCWKKRKDGKTTREDHMKLKVQGTEVRLNFFLFSFIKK